MLDAVLATLSRLFRDNPDVAHYSRSDVQKHSASPETPTSLVALLNICGLAGSGMHSDSDFRFEVPQDIEHVVSHKNGRAMLECAQCDAARWDPVLPRLTEPTALPAEPPSVLPLTVRRLDCSFITDPELARIIQRDCDEIVSCIEVEAWKAILILCGSALEGLLTFALETTDPANSGGKLADLIRTSVSNGLLTKMGQALPDALRDHRNLVHPSKERGAAYHIDKPEAAIAVGILEAALRDVASALAARKSAPPLA